MDEHWLVQGQKQIVRTTQDPLRDEQGHIRGTLDIVEERRLLSEALRHSAVSVLVANPQGRITYANPTFCRLFGYDNPELSDLSITHLCPPDPISQTQQRMLSEQLRLLGRWSGELVRLARDGTPLPVHASIGVVRDPEGAITGFVTSYLDLRPLKAREAALTQVRDCSRLYLDTMQALMVALDMRGRITMINRAGCALLGYAASELLGRPWFETCLPQPEGMAQLFPVFQRIMAGEIDSAEQDENFVLCRDGRRRLIAWNNAILTDETGAIIGTLSSGEDVTERRLAEQALRESDERWIMAIDSAGHGVWDWNAATNKVFFSRQWKAMLGYGEEEIGDGLEEWYSRIHPDDLACCHADLERHFRGETPVYRSEHRIRCKDGSYKWILDQGRVISHGPEGRPLRVIGTHTDISERKAAEEELRQQNKALERFNRASVGRELEMIRLKQQVNELTIQLGQVPPYPLEFLNPPDPRAGEEERP